MEITFKHLQCPDIPDIKQANANGKRHYETPVGPLVSITTVIHHFTPEGINNGVKALVMMLQIM